MITIDIVALIIRIICSLTITYAIIEFIFAIRG